MSALDFRFVRDGLTILIERSEGEATVTWQGISDARNPGQVLRPVLDHITHELKDVKVTLDFTGLEYMNSSTVSPIISLIKALDAGGKDTLVVFSDTDWQVTHLRCMKAIARMLSHVRVEASSERAASSRRPPLSSRRPPA